MSTIFQRCERVLERLEAAALRAGRAPSEIKVLLASKNQPPAALLEAQRAFAAFGRLPIFGENYVQAAKERPAILQRPYELHLIGNLQSNKARAAAKLFDVIQSVDSLKIAKLLALEAAHLGKRLRIFVQVNISNDSAKSGAKADELEELVGEIRSTCNNLSLDGLMAITRQYREAGEARADFRNLRELSRVVEAHGSGSLELSMGMSDDFEVAIEEGASLVRLGSAIFEETLE